MIHRIGSSVCTSASPHLHGFPRGAVVRSLTLCSSPCSFPCVSPVPCSSLSTSTSSMWSTSGQSTLALRQLRSLAPLAENTPLTDYEPKLPDDFYHCGNLPGRIQRRGPSYLLDTELDDEAIDRAHSSPLFVQEREEPANRRQAYHSLEQSLLPAHSFSVCLS